MPDLIGRAWPATLRASAPSSPLVARTSAGGKYFGSHPDKSIKTLAFCVAIEIAVSCQRTEEWVKMTVSPGKSAATSVGILFHMNMGIDRNNLIKIPCMSHSRLLPDIASPGRIAGRQELF